MNVALFASAFHPHVGGVEELVRQLALAHEAAGHRVIIVTNRWPRSLPPHEVVGGITVYRPALRIPEGGVKARVNYHLTHRSVRNEIFGLLRRNRVDVMHVQCVSTNGYYALLARRALGLPLVVTAQGERTMDAAGLYQRSQFMNRVLRALLTEADHVTACSSATLDDLTTHFGMSLAGRSEVIPNGINPDDFAGVEPHRGRRPYALGLGRLVPQKGFDVLLDAFARAGLDEVDLVIAGEGPERTSLERAAAGFGLAGRVQFFGRADRAQVAALFKGCLFFALPSRQEPFGIVSLEAMEAGKAVIASATGGVPEVVSDGATGLLVPPGDPAALAAAMRRVASDAGLRDSLVAAGRARAADFTWRALAQRYLATYERVALRAGHDGRVAVSAHPSAAAGVTA